MGPGQIGLFAVTDLAATDCYLRFVNVSVEARTLNKLVGIGILSGLSVMDETRKYKSLALGPGRLLNVGFSSERRSLTYSIIVGSHRWLGFLNWKAQNSRRCSSAMYMLRRSCVRVQRYW